MSGDLPGFRSGIILEVFQIAGILEDLIERLKMEVK